MISIHLRREGAKKDPHYRVVVADSRAARDGAFIEVLGHYHPRYQPARIFLDVDAVKRWIGQGAQPSDTVRNLLKQIETGQLAMEEPPQPTAAAADAGAGTDEGAADAGDDAGEAAAAAGDGAGEAAATSGEAQDAVKAAPADEDAGATDEAEAKEEEGDGEKEPSS